MSGRIQKSTKTSQRSVLARAIELGGQEVMPGSYWYKQQRVYRMAEKSYCCGECVRRGIRELDDVDGVHSQEDAVIAEQQAVGEAQLAGAVDMINWSSILDLGDDLAYSKS